MDAKHLLLSLLVVIAAAPACGPPENDSDAGDTGTTDTYSEVGPDAGDTSDTSDVGAAPTIDDVSITENPKNVLSAFVEVETTPASEVTVELKRDAEVVETFDSDGEASNHEVFIMGMYAETEHTLTVEVSANGQTTSTDETYTTSALPDDVPPLEVKASNPDIAADGYRLIDLFRWKEDGSGSADDWGMALAVDENGKIVWYYQADHQIWDITRSSQGTLTYNDHHEGVHEIDMQGNEVNHWSAAEDLGLEPGNDECCLHHGVSELDNGNFLALTTEMKEINGYMPDGSSAKVVGDVAVEFNRSGEVVVWWSMFDVLSDYTTRKKTGSLGPYWDDDYGEDVKDWTHGNAIEVGDTDGTLIASLRHQDWIVKWAQDAPGDLLWRFGPQGDFELAGNGKFPYHQHSPHWMENGNLLVYDNGNARPSIQEGNQYYTRVVEYDLDASNVDVGNTKGTAEQVWAYKNDPQFYAPYVGDADPLPNGTILIADGGVLGDPSMCIDFDENGDPVDKTGACIGSGDNLKWARLHEVTHDANKETALEIWIKDTSDSPTSYTMYRSDYISTLYPAGDGGTSD